MLTEQQLWRAMQGANERHDLGMRMTRVETGVTATGVSDVSYVSQQQSGWVELKVSRSWREETRVVLQCEFTMDQFAWLVTHNNTHIHLRSWLLIGVERAGAWDRFVLLEPAPAGRFVEGRGLEAPVMKQLLKDPRVSYSYDISDVLRIIAGNGKGRESR